MEKVFLLQLNKRYKTEEFNAFITMKSQEFNKQWLTYIKSSSWRLKINKRKKEEKSAGYLDCRWMG